MDDVRKSLIAQYQATGPAELMLVDLALSSYFRALRTNQAYHLLLNQTRTNAPQEQINFYKEIGRQIEFAHKQFVTALTFLKELRQPPVSVKIQTQNAFVANNQQVNQYKDDNEKPLIANDLEKNEQGHY